VLGDAGSDFGHITIVTTEQLGEELTLLNCAQEVPGSHLNWNTERPDCSFRIFPQFLHADAGIVHLKFRQRPFPSTLFSIQYLLSSNHSTLQSLGH
jgi:hypothetical protein